jgi:YHS domain-containing protein
MKNIIVILVLLSPFFAQGQSEIVRKKHFNIKKLVALDGYDPISYFDGNVKEGNEALTFTYKGVSYQFISQTNLNKFKSSPEKYEPAYGGWCAYAMGQTGEKVKVDPETYKILEGKLYLFYNFWGNNTLTDWNELEKKLKESGDRNWAKTIQ